MDKRVSALAYAVTFAGCYLGAGYVSGQELWQFFGVFGYKGIIGFIFTLFLLFFFAVILLFLAKREGIEELDVVITGEKSTHLRALVAAAELIILFGIFVIMAAGAGALINQILPVPVILGSFVFCFMVAAVGIKGIDGIISAFSFIVPALVISSVIISCACLIKGDIFSLHFEAPSRENPLISNPVISSVTYLSYNFFGSIGILLPFAKLTENKKSVITGTAIGCGFLFVIAIGILLSLFLTPQSITAPLPMLYLASKISPALGYIYAFLLLCGMFGTSLSSLVAIVNFREKKQLKKVPKSTGLIVILSLLAFIGSFAGFGNLIGTVYPIFGYFGFFALFGILYNFLKSNRKKHNKKPL